jgi:polysaccharide biosynthesis/export protein
MKVPKALRPKGVCGLDDLGDLLALRVAAMRAQSTFWRSFVLAACAALSSSVHPQAAAEAPQSSGGQARQATEDNQLPSGVTPPAGYVIGADDLLSVRFWADTQLSTDVVVRPDGKISVPLLNDVQAAGLTPEQLNTVLEKAASKFIADANATVIVREVRSRKVYVLGQVARPNPVPLNTDMTVLQVLTAVGGLQEYADRDNITIVRLENGRERRFKFNYNQVVKGKNVQQNILLQPGDTVIVN